MHTASEKPTFFEILPAIISRGLEDLSTTHETLLARMSQIAKKKGTESAWDWIEAHVDRPFDKSVCAEIEGVVTMWLQIRPHNPRRKGDDDHPVARLVAVRKAADSLVNAVAALEADESYYMSVGDEWCVKRITLDLVPQLLAVLDTLRPQHARRNSFVADKMLISTLKDVFEREVGARATTTPTGQFCRLLAAVWEILPPDQRCATAESFVSYARKPLDDLEDDPSEPM